MSGCGPEDVVIGEGGVDDGAQGMGMTDGSHPADGEAGVSADEFRIGAVYPTGIDQVGDFFGVDGVPSAGEDEKRLVVCGKDQTFDDLPDGDAEGGGGFGCSAGGVGQEANLRVDAGGPERLVNAGDRRGEHATRVARQ